MLERLGDRSKLSEVSTKKLEEMSHNICHNSKLYKLILINLSFHLLPKIPLKFVMLMFSFSGEHIDQENNLQLLRRLNLIG